MRSSRLGLSWEDTVLAQVPSACWCCAWHGENPYSGTVKFHGELLVFGVKVTASTVWEILQEAGIEPRPSVFPLPGPASCLGRLLARPGQACHLTSADECSGPTVTAVAGLGDFPAMVCRFAQTRCVILPI